MRGTYYKKPIRSEAFRRMADLRKRAPQAVLAAQPQPPWQAASAEADGECGRLLNPEILEANSHHGIQLPILPRRYVQLRRVRLGQVFKEMPDLGIVA